MQLIAKSIANPRLWLVVFILAEIVGWMPVYLPAMRHLPGWLMWAPAVCLRVAPLFWLVYGVMQYRRYRHTGWRQRDVLLFAISGLACLLHVLFLVLVLFIDG